jgi:predicted Zn-dependent protease
MRARAGRGLAAACLALSLAGCKTGLFGAEPPPVAAPRAGPVRPADRDHAKLVAAFGGEVRSAPLTAFLSEVAGRVVPATDRPDQTYQITILDSPAVNAFALPSGRLYVTRGLLALANDTDEIAAVLAHEIAHVTLRHASARLELEARSALVSRVVADVLRDPDGSAVVRDRARLQIASFSRAQELEADQISVATLAKAGYDPFGAARFLASLDRTLGLRAPANGRNASPDMLSTHPGASERVGLARQAARRIGAPGLVASDRARYLATIDGLAYGDGTAAGVIRGRRFIHPRLGVAFEAPEGVILENTARAVLGASADGTRRLLFDPIEAPERRGLADVLRATWSDALEKGSVESLEVNGHPAAAATSRGRDWTFRLAAVRVGSTTYRLILASRSGGPELEGAFRQTLDSLRTVSPEEARGLRPPHIQIVTALPGETVEGMASRMAAPDRPVERFLILNGLEPGSGLAPGQRYKIVVE